MERIQEMCISRLFLDKIKKIWTKQDSFVFFCAFLTTLLVHMYMFTHKFLNHDDVGGLYSDCAFGLSSGRWLLAIVKKLTGSFSSAWLNGLVGALFLSIAVVFVVRLFKIRSKLPAVLIAVCMVSFPVVASTYTYMFCAPQYFFALAASAVGTWLIRKEKLWSMFAGAVAISLGMGCYQVYFSFAAVLLVTLLAIDLFEDSFEANWKKFMVAAIKYVLSLAAGMILYFAVLKVCLYITETELVSYSGMDTMGQLTLTELWSRIRIAYNGFSDFCFNRRQFLHEGFHFVVLAIVSMISVVTLGCIITKKIYRRPELLCFGVVLIIVFPLASSLVYIMTAWQNVHTVMMYPLVVILLMPAVVMDKLTLRMDTRGSLVSKGKVVLFVVFLILQLVVGYEGVVITNRAYFCMDLTYENAYAYFVKLTTKIEMQEVYTPDMPIALIGEAKMDSAVPRTNLQGVLTGNQALNYYTVDRFLCYFLGESYPFASEIEKEYITSTEVFMQMPCYPAAGSIAPINGIMVVKLS